MHRYDQDIKLGIEKNSIGNGAESYQYSGEKLDILTYNQQLTRHMSYLK